MVFSLLPYAAGHNVRNAESARYKHLCALRSDFRLLLSGTIVQVGVDLQLFPASRYRPAVRFLLALAELSGRAFYASALHSSVLV